MYAKHVNLTARHQTCSRIETILKETMGLHAASIGSSTITSSVQRRMVACGVSNVDAYLALLLSSTGELDALIEEVVIPETWFFRDGKAFEALRRFVTNEWMPKHKQGKLRVLSLPCSTGEEPYTIAMTLIEAGLAVERIYIDAVDISMQALAKARCAVYGDNAFRGNDLVFRDRFFHKTKRVYTLDKKIHERVNFIQANMLNPDFMPGQGIYDVVFCRNVMIYFDALTQTQAMAVLTRLLHANGILFVGHAESSMILNHGYVSEQIPRAFAFRKSTAKHNSKPRIAAATNTQHHQQKKTRVVMTPQPASLFRADKESSISSSIKQETSTDERLEQAFCLADEGNLVEAASLCENWLEDNEPCVQACYLLGLIREATGNREEAEDYLRKVVYLQPDHQEALVHLSLLVEQKGDVSAAKILRQRASRATASRAASRSETRNS